MQVWMQKSVWMQCGHEAEYVAAFLAASVHHLPLDRPPPVPRSHGTGFAHRRHFSPNCRTSCLVEEA